MMVKIYSSQSLDDQIYGNVVDILQHSQCPHESLMNTYGDQYYTMIDLGEIIQVYFVGAVPDVAYCYEIQI